MNARQEVHLHTESIEIDAIATAAAAAVVNDRAVIADHHHKRRQGAVHANMTTWALMKITNGDIDIHTRNIVANGSTAPDVIQMAVRNERCGQGKLWLNLWVYGGDALVFSILLVLNDWLCFVQLLSLLFKRIVGGGFVFFIYFLFLSDTNVRSNGLSECFCMSFIPFILLSKLI